MESFEVSYTPMTLPDIAKKDVFVTMVELSHGIEYLVVGDISHTYQEAQNKRIFHSRQNCSITDSFVRAFDTEAEAKAYISRHEKWSA